MANPNSNYQLKNMLKVSNFGVLYNAVGLEGKNAGIEVVVKQLTQLPQEWEDGVPYSVIREISLLQLLSHGDHIIRLLDVEDFVNPMGDLVHHLIFEKMNNNLREHVENNDRSLSNPAIKLLMFQLCEGVAFLHGHAAMHRDLKPDNVLLDLNLNLKIADFGHARQFEVPTGKFSLDAMYSGYKPPEILLKIEDYTVSADVWSVGCIFAYLASGTEPFKPVSNEDPLDLIFGMLGTPTEEEWPGVTMRLDDSDPVYPKMPLPRSLLEYIDNDGYELLKEMLQMNPAKRISALEALKHPYFKEIIP